MKFLYLGALCALMATPVVAETPANPPNAPVISADGALYRQFGGHDGMVKLVDDLFVNVDADSRINGFFDKTKRDHTKAMLVEQFCQITGGGCTYSGKDMKASHSQLGIKQEDFYALVEDLQKAMTADHVPFTAQNQLLGALAPQSRSIVYKSGTNDPIKPPKT